MRKYLFAAAAAAALAAPATARDNSPYIGIEGGVLLPQKQNVYGSADFTNPAVTDIASGRIGSVKPQSGFDVALFGGYDFGLFRLEGELGYKQAKLKGMHVDPGFVAAVNKAAGTSLTGADFGFADKTKVYSAMVNALVEHELFDGVRGFVGAGAGYASVHEFGGKRGKFAWQLLAGLEKPVSKNIDAGIKYRYFRTGKLDFDNELAFSPGTGTCGTAPCSGGTASFNSHDSYSSHSILASLTYNFGSARTVPPPAPPLSRYIPELPPTQTCPDGSVIAPTSKCAITPAPVTIPAAPAERGERGH